MDGATESNFRFFREHGWLRLEQAVPHAVIAPPRWLSLVAEWVRCCLARRSTCTCQWASIAPLFPERPMGAHFDRRRPCCWSVNWDGP